LQFGSEGQNKDITRSLVMPQSFRAQVLENPKGTMAVRKLQLQQPGVGEVLVRVAASGINPLDLKIRDGAAAHAKAQYPGILGMDMAGIVDAVGPNVAAFERGDRVFGMVGGVGGIAGTLAEYVVADHRLLALAPRGMPMREVASLPLVFITAWEGLIDRARISMGEKVLIHGGAGGVGHAAIQIARAHGAQVFSTGGDAASLAIINGLGAVPINYRDCTVEQYVAQHTSGTGFDVVFDTVGGGTLDDSFSAISRFGRVVSALGWGMHSLAPLSFRSGTYSGVFTLLPLLTGIGREHYGDILRQARELAESRELTALVDPREFTLSDADTAFAHLGQRQSKGKIVVTVDPGIA
jgi:NADPH2:quinone reductase